MKQGIVNGWNFFRIFRLIIGIIILIQAFIAKDLVMGTVGLLFIMMPIFNIGCCSSNGCYTPIKNANNKIQDITYEEVV